MAIFSFSFYHGNTVVSSIRELTTTTMMPAVKTSLKKRICHPFKALFGPAQFVKCWPVFLEWILKEFIQVQERKEYCCLIFTATATIKRRIRKFHVYVAQLTSKKKTNIQGKKRDASAELLFCLKTNRFFWRCHRGRRPVPLRVYWTIIRQ